jgi:hypothetical protein
MAPVDDAVVNNLELKNYCIPERVISKDEDEVRGQ